jgi:uncharacterized protein YggE
MPSITRFASLAAVALIAMIVPSAASAQQPATLTASGSAQVKPEPSNRKSEASIHQAVEAAETEALPKAIAEAREHANKLAAAAGVKLGALVSISDSPAPGYPFFYYGQYGTFGNGKFCGQVRNTRFVVRDGRRRRVAAKGTHKVCRVPPQVQASASVTFAIVP